MFDAIDKYRNVVKILLGLIALSFVTFGVHSFTHSGRDYIIVVGDEKITERDIRQAIQSNNLPSDENTRNQIYQSLLQQAYMINGAKKNGCLRHLGATQKRHRQPTYLSNRRCFRRKQTQTVFEQQRLERARFGQRIA